MLVGYDEHLFWSWAGYNLLSTNIKGWGVGIEYGAESAVTLN